MIHFQFPELFLLAIPLWFVYRRWGSAPGVTGGLRIVLLMVLLLALTGPRVNLGGKGIDVLVVADRSRSLPGDAERRIRELIHNLETNRHAGDRVGVVTFGSSAAVESVLSEGALLKEYQKEILPDGSDLDDALQVALNLVDPRRPARVVVLSDGEANGASPGSAARRARDLGVPIDFREFPRPRIGDVAVDSLELPETVAPREPFQYTVRVHSDRTTGGRVSVFRDGEAIAGDQQDRQFLPGMNQLLFRDLLEEGGLHRYEIRLEVADDPLPENNRGLGVVRVEAGPRILVLNARGEPDNFVRALQAGHVPVDVAASKTHPLTQDSLDRYRAVVLENVPAGDLGRLKMERLAQFVEDLGGGLLVTGGERSFGNGGYFKSPLDELLPVSMEMREEHRKTRLAMVIALDRSGSMAVPVKGGRLKMDLANLGAVEAIRLLSPGDSIAVIAVDSSPHIIQGLTAVDDTSSITNRVLSIESMGGGIFVYEALVAAGKQLMDAEQLTRHIILFSDANDSEQPGDYAKLLAEYEKAGITTSVIGLGTAADSDAKLLEDIARRGKGNIMFTEDAQELPRLFTEDTLSVARNSFVQKDPETQPEGITARVVPGARLMGELVPGAFPAADGYNLSYLKPDATLAVVSEDEYSAPWSAFWYRGLGRAAAVTLEVDGPYSGAFGRSDNYADFAITHARWLLGGGSPEDVYLRLDREGQEAVVTLELDPDRPSKPGAESPTLGLVAPSDERAVALDLPFQWTGPHSLEARFKLTREGTYRTLVKLGGRNVVRGPAVTLPYSPEFMPREGLPTGREVLEELARLTGGRERLDLLEVLADPPRSSRTTPLLPWLLIAALALLLTEIAGRRLSLWTRSVDVIEARAPRAEGSALSSGNRARTWWPTMRSKRSVPAASTASTPTEPAPAPPSQASPSHPPAAAPSANAIFEQAKRRARNRLHD
jgi:Mg-chelatase subunit ChlD